MELINVSEIWHTDYYLDFYFYFFTKIWHSSPVSPITVIWDGQMMTMVDRCWCTHSLPLCQHPALAFCILNRLVSSLTPWSAKLKLASSATCHTAKLAKGKALHLPQCRLISAVLSGTDRSTLHCPQRGGPTHLSLESRQRQEEGVKQRETNNMIPFGFLCAVLTEMYPFMEDMSEK